MSSIGAKFRPEEGEDIFLLCASLELALESDPDNPDLMRKLMTALRRDARYKDAIRMADRLLMIDGDDIDALYEKAVCLARLGDGAASLSWFDRTLRVNSDHAAAWFGSHGPALEINNLGDAVRRIERAATRIHANGRYWGFAHALLLLSGRENEAKALYEERLLRHANRRIISDGAAALLPYLAKDFRLFGISSSLLCYGLSLAKQEGLVLEFGVRRGTSLSVLAKAAGQDVYGFDSFEGLPEFWVGKECGALTTGGILPDLPENAHLCPGWFAETLPAFLAQHQAKARFVNIDSDLYSSAHTVLFGMKAHWQKGSILVFDEMIGNRSWREDEYRAFMEFIHETGFGFEIVAASPLTKQVALRLL